MKEFSSLGGGPADTRGLLACRVGREGEGAGGTWSPEADAAEGAGSRCGRLAAFVRVLLA